MILFYRFIILALEFQRVATNNPFVQRKLSNDIHYWEGELDRHLIQQRIREAL